MNSAQIMAHANRIFRAVVIAGDLAHFPVAERSIELSGSGVVRSDFEAHVEGSRHDGGLLEPLDECATNPLALTIVIHTEQIEMGGVLTEMHDREPDATALNVGSQDNTIAMGDVTRNASRCPRPGQPRFHQTA